MRGTVISFDKVNWLRNGQAILKNISWNVHRGEHWGILGLNGSGKTSLLNVVTGYHYPTSGRVQVLGNEFGKTNIPKLRRRIGYVSSSFEKYSQHLLRDQVERIVVSGKFASFGLYEEVPMEDWKKVDELLELLGLTYLTGKYYRDLSQGERRKVLIARALMAEPEILILDEPCSGLDVLSRENVLEIMEQVKEQNCHLLYVTHHIEEIREVITHVLLIRDGEVIAAGPKQEVLTSTLLSETYKLPVQIRWENERPWLTIPKVHV